jgi:uncharacterized repeat protein (TIGR03803 family)
MRFYRLFSILLSLMLAPLVRGQTLEWVASAGNEPYPGNEAYAGLLQGRDGNLYGTTFNSVFKLSTNGVVTTLSSAFDFIRGVLIEESDGVFYGTSFNGGSFDRGTIFKITSDGTVTTLFDFNSSFTNGFNPRSGLIRGNDGDYYGTTTSGGTGFIHGTIFKMTTNGILTTVLKFEGTNGSFPRAGLTLGTDGNFYGTTERGGINNSGTVYKLTPDGVLTTLHSFNFLDGSYPVAGLIENDDGNFYGITAMGGNFQNLGTVFKITTNGLLTTLAIFNGTNGTLPYSTLLKASDGNFYGTSYGGGANTNYGTIFKLTPAGTFSTVFSFTATNSLNPGSNPVAGLMQARDGNLYGITQYGAYIFRIVMPVSLISRVSGSELVLSWPTNALGFILQSAADLNSPTNWIDSTNSPTVVGAQFTVTNSISASAQFYRLKKP